jgi:hypothetical protein
MKRVFVTPGAIARQINASLPQITSRRMGLQAHRKGAVAYKTDGDPKDGDDPVITKEWLVKELADTKKALEDAQTKKFAETLEPEIKKAFGSRKLKKLSRQNLLKSRKLSTTLLQR